jgi:hypothetical protein
MPLDSPPIQILRAGVVKRLQPGVNLAVVELLK